MYAATGAGLMSQPVRRATMAEVETMELGIFHEFHRAPGGSETEAFDEAFAQAEAAEQYGFDAIWLAELHFSPSRSVLAAPMVIAAALARSEEHTSELQALRHLVCRLLLEKRQARGA